jgi:predicted dehydrogenase
MSNRMKVSVIGASHAGRDFHIPGLSVFPDVDLSVCDINEPLLKSVCDQFGIPPERRYPDYRQMLERENPEAALVLMAQYRHGNYKPDIYFQIVNELLDQGRHVLVEKPPAMTPEEAKPLVDKAEKTGVVTMVSVNRRFNPLVALCKKAVEMNGPVLNVNCDFYKGADPSAKGALDWLTGDMIHALDLMRFLLGSEIVDLHSAMTRTEADEVPTAFHALARCANGATGIFSANVRVGERIQLWQLHGVHISAILTSDAVYPMEEGGYHMSATLYRPQEKPVTYHDTELPTGGRPYLNPADFHVRNGFAYADRYFVNCVRNRQQPHCNFADGYRTLCLCRQISQGEVRVVI